MSFVLEASRKALSMATPEIMNSDQGSHFTSHKFTDPFLKAGSKISMDHRGRAFDNIMIERLWRSVKHEEVYLKAYDTVKQAKQSIAEYLDFYNTIRPHSSLNKATPNEFYDQHLLKVMAA